MRRRLSERPEDFEDDLLRMLFDATAFANMDETELEKYNSIMTTKLDIIAREEYARKEGEAVGEARGIAKTMHTLLASGMSMEELRKRLNLSEEEVAAILAPSS